MTVGVPVKYRKKPVVIEAMRITWENWEVLCGWVQQHEGLTEGLPADMRGVWVDPDTGEYSDEAQWGMRGEIGLLVPTLEGTMLGRQGDMLIRGVQGEWYPCRRDIFLRTYEPVY